MRSTSTSSQFKSSLPPSSGDYGQELEKRKFNDKDETDYYDSLEFCADLVWNGEFVLDVTIVRIFTLALSSEYLVKQQKGHPMTYTALFNVFDVDILDTVLLSLHPESKVKASEVSERTKEGLKELHCFNALIHLDQVSKAEMEHLLESLPNTYASQLGQFNPS